MCEPATLATAALVIAGASTAMQVYSSVAQGQAQSAQYKYRAKIDETNAQAAHYQADDARVRGQQEEIAQRRKTAGLMETQKTALGGMGFDMYDSTGSAILADTAQLGEIDAQTIRQNAGRQAWGFEQQERNYRQNAGLNSMSASNAGTAGWLNAGSSLFSGASSIADKWYSYNNNSNNITWNSARVGVE